MKLKIVRKGIHWAVVDAEGRIYGLRPTKRAARARRRELQK